MLTAYISVMSGLSFFTVLMWTYYEFEEFLEELSESESALCLFFRGLNMEKEDNET